LEKGEVIVIAANVVMLVALVYLLNLGGQNASGTTSGPINLQSANWGPPNMTQTIPFAQTLVTSVNESQIYVGFAPPQGTYVASATASRVCQYQNGSQGQVRTYDSLSLQVGSSGQEFLVISPAAQAVGLQCTYSATISLSDRTEFTWTGSVVLQ